MNELVFSLRTTPNEKLSNSLDSLLESYVRDKRMSETTWQARKNSPEIMEKRKNIQESNAEFGQISAIGVWQPAKKQPKQVWRGNEEDLVADFWTYCEKYLLPFRDITTRDDAPLPSIVGNGCLIWQLPFLLKRTALLGLRPTGTWPVLERRNNQHVYDLSIHWTQNPYSEMTLDEMATYFDLELPEDLESELDLIWELYHRIRNAL